jgi:hypothetical protein
MAADALTLLATELFSNAAAVSLLLLITAVVFAASLPLPYRLPGPTDGLWARSLRLP